MDMVKSVLKEELEHSLEMLEHYRVSLSGLPRGSLVKKRINGREYWYVVRREEGKIKTHYVGKADGEEAAAMRKEMEKRRHYEELLREVERKIRYLKKVIDVRAV